MKILMLGNSYTFFNDMPVKLAELTGAEVVGNLRGGACLWQQLDPNDDLSKKCAALLAQKDWDYIVLQEHSRGTFEFPKEFFDASRKLCMIAREMGA
ncbi:MAG: SGNH/GDSL hydrolase family protein, partial [Clostridia bacterium]|nr:SGNH/GDSL hydrolase family protein [Clostridia bacterium]